MAKEEHECSICHKIYSRLPYARVCESSHDIVYIQFLRSDLQRLIQFLYSGDHSLLTESLMKTLMKYNSRIKGDSK
jgi:hypothetical protein